MKKKNGMNDLEDTKVEIFFFLFPAARDSEERNVEKNTKFL
jgi:hypothetical protein